MLMKCWQTTYSISLVSKMSINSFTLEVQDLTFEVHKKDIKNLHINILPPNGRYESAPLDMSTESIRLAIVTKLSRIKKKFGNEVIQP